MTHAASIPLHLTLQKAPALPAMSSELPSSVRAYQGLSSMLLRSGNLPKRTQCSQLRRMSYGTGCQWRDYLEWRYAVQAVESAGKLTCGVPRC